MKRIAKIQYEQLQQYEDAIQSYTEIINNCGESKVKNDAYFDRARAYYSKGDYAGSIADNHYVLSVLSESRWASYNLALAYEMNDETQKAIDNYGVALEGYVRDGDLEGASVILQRRGDLYAQIEDYTSAVNDFQKSLEYKPDNKYVAQRYEEVLPMAGGKGAIKTVITNNDKNVVNNTNNKKVEKKSRPTITILEPSVSRGLKVIHRDDMIKVRGKADDVTGISEVIVNNIFATLETNGEFSVFVTLEPGDNTIFVTATNNNGYSTQEVFTVEKAAGEIRTESATEKRVALIIGNSAYTDSPLPNPVNDANLMAKTLTGLGFEVIVKLDVANDDEMKKAIRDFGVRIRDGGVGLFYYAGHGIQVNGKNYLIPTRAQINKEPDVEYEGIDVNMVLAEMDYARNRMNIVVLDACRNNPFARSFRSASRGLAQVDAPAGSYIAYSTAPGEVASDGSTANSPFTDELSRAMTTPGLSLEQVFKKVRTGVRTQTSGQQIPWTSSSIEGEFYFVK